jgi:phosphatidylinositol-3-phosphatase
VPVRTAGRVLAAAALVLVAACGGASDASAPAATSAAPSAAPASSPATSPATPVPAFDHVVVLVEENRSATQVIGSGAAPYLTSLARGGANMTQSYAVAHPSQPNYLALFSGSTQGITGDACPNVFAAENLGHQVLAAGRTFAGYSEGLPSAGYTGCTSGRYARKHSPWVDFSSVPSSANRPFTDFPATFDSLPALSFVIPDLCNDMHDCAVAVGDSWARSNLGAYASWARSHNSLLVVTFDEDDHSAGNRIPTVFSGAHVATGSYAEHITHYTVLRTLQAIAGVGCVAESCSATALTDIWN